MLAQELPDDMREDLLRQREKSSEYAESIAEWDAQFEDYLAYFKAKIFIDLKEGKLIGLGAKIDGSTWSELISNIGEYDIRLESKEMQQINKNEWIARNINWEHSVLICSRSSYCWVNFDVGAILDLYPMPKSPPVGTIWKLGDVYVSEADEGLEDSLTLKRGRPSLPWDQFHIEVAALIKANALPEKKEAAIIHFETWFREILGIAAGRSSIGQRLTPYYNRFIRSPTENTKS
jgi:hypothetical protein